MELLKNPKYVALASDAFACRALPALTALGATTGVLDSLADSPDDQARIVLFSAPAACRFPGRHMRIVSPSDAESRKLTPPPGLRKGDVAVALCESASEKHRANLPAALRQLHTTLTGWKAPKRKRDRSRASEDWRRGGFALP